MQPQYCDSERLFRTIAQPSRLWAPQIAWFLLLIAVLPGCRQPPNLVDPAPTQPYKGMVLTIDVGRSLSHPEWVEQFARDWSNRTGATVQFAAGPADIRLIRATELPKWVLEQKIRQIPETIRTSHHKYQWNDLPVPIADKLASWEGKVFGLPVFAEGQVLIYRTDTWKDYLNSVKLPADKTLDTWEDLCELAEFAHRNWNATSLPTAHEDASDELHRIASSYDREVVNEGGLGSGPKSPEEVDAFFSFDFGVESGEPRLNATAFRHAARILKRLQACRPRDPAANPSVAFGKGNAVATLASLDEVAALSHPDSPVARKWKIAPIPGSHFTFQPGELDETKALRVPVTPGGAVNRVPYLGANIWLGVVSRDCENPEAAIDFLAEMANPATTSLELIGAGKWGAGGFRVSHFDSRNRNHWYGYGLDAPNTELLADIQRQNVGVTVANYTLALRLSNRDDYVSILNNELKRGLEPDGDIMKTLDEAQRKWKEKKLDISLYRISLGL